MRTRLIALGTATLAAASLGLVGCSSSADSAPAATVAASVIAAPASPQRVDAPTFAGVIASPNVTLIDVRTPDEFAAGHIDGAVNMDVQGADFATQIATLDPAGVYAVYCHSGNRSQVAVAAMAQAGITGIYELESGISGWQAAGYPVTS